jgi:hypothetical protein
VRLKAPAGAILADVTAPPVRGEPERHLDTIKGICARLPARALPYIEQVLQQWEGVS